MEKNTSKSLLILHLSVLLFSFSSLIAKSVNVSSLTLTWSRTLLAAITLYILMKVFSKKEKLIHKEIFNFQSIFNGIILALHWLTFFMSVQIASVAIAVITFSCFPVFVILFEPAFMKTPLQKKFLPFAFSTIVGASLIVDYQNFNNYLIIGPLLGFISAILFAVFSLINKKMIRNTSAIKLSLIQNAIGFVFLTPFFIYKYQVPGQEDLVLIIVLGIFITGIAHFLYVASMKVLSASLSGITVMLESVYAIVFAFILFGSFPQLRVLIGGLIILISVFVVTRLDQSNLEL